MQFIMTPFMHFFRFLQILIEFETCLVFLSHFVIAREKIRTEMITVQYSAGWLLDGDPQTPQHRARWDF